MSSVWHGEGSDSIAGDRLRPFLSTNERPIWAGGPQRGIVLQSTDLLQVPIGLFFLAFALFWEYSVLSIPRGAPTVFALWGLIFVVVGLYLAVGRFFYDALLRSRTSYGLTNHRVLILTALGPARLVSRDLENLGPVTVVERPDRRGTITFGTPVSTSWLAWSRNTAAQTPMFGMIPDVQGVATKIREAERAARAG
jgi:hypothetical protein